MDEFNRLIYIGSAVRVSQSGRKATSQVTWQLFLSFFTYLSRIIGSLQWTLTPTQGYHVQVTARTDRDLTPESIIRKVSDASGSRYSGDSAAATSGGPPPSIASKPAFMPTHVGGGSDGFNPLKSQSRTSASRDTTVDEDGWGSDAPQVTRTQLEKVQSAYQPTKVNMSELTSQKPEISKYNEARHEAGNGAKDSITGAYQPVGKVDIAAIRRQAQEAGSIKDDRPAPVKGSYEPIGKVDIAAIRAKAQGPGGNASPSAPPISPSRTGTSAQGIGEDDSPRSLADRSAAFTASERITAMPKPKVSNKFGSNTSGFIGTKAPVPGAFESKPAAPIGLASRTFADEGGKTPAQIWAEKKGRQRGSSGAGGIGRPEGPNSPIASQTSGSGDWKSGYSGKSWAPVQTSKTGQPASSGVTEQGTDEEQPEEEPVSPPGNVGAIRDRFKGAVPMGAPSIRPGSSGDEQPPRMDMSSKPNAGNARGIPIPGMLPRQQSAEEDVPDEETPRMPTPPAQPPRTPTPPTPTGSPIRVAMPVARSNEHEMKATQELKSPPAMPIQSLERIIPAAKDLEDEPQAQHDDPARAAGQAAAATTFGIAAGTDPMPGDHVGGKRALILFDYEKAEENELELIEGEYVTDIEMVDEDWWMGQNSKGEAGLFPSNYVELAAGVDKVTAPTKVPGPAASTPAAAPPAATVLSGAAKRGPTATAQYDYEAVEDNELSFPDGAIITALVSSMFYSTNGTKGANI